MDLFKVLSQLFELSQTDTGKNFTIFVICNDKNVKMKNICKMVVV